LGFVVNPRNKIILTGFLNRTFAGENAKNHAFCGGEKLKSSGVYQARIKHGAAQWKSTFRLCGFAPSRWAALLNGHSVLGIFAPCIYRRPKPFSWRTVVRLPC
jgi:hypothetical protein